MKVLYCIFLIVFYCKICFPLCWAQPSGDGTLNWKELATKYGFPNVEKRDVITQDGYILSLYHIPGDPSKPVLLTHGNTASAHCWIDRGDTSLAITLARRGYDVWAINFRGVFESQRHEFLDARKQSQAFFNFTFYEQGIYDLPATIDFILNETKQEQLLGIGHSYGTTVYYVLGSEKPDYNNKIKAFISLAPVSYFQHPKGIARFTKLSQLALFGYGCEEPPEFDLSKVSMKVALFVGKKDYLSSVPDAEHLNRTLTNVVHYKELPYEHFNHLDFIYGQFMPVNLYPFIMPIIEKYV